VQACLGASLKLHAVDAPEVRYVKSGDVSIAYATVGEGPFDLVFVGGWVLSVLGSAWDGPAADTLSRLASFSRLILFDKRGTGASDRSSAIPDFETRMDDIRAVMDAVGSERAALLGVSEGGPMTLLFAATYPERTAAAVLYATGASWMRAADYCSLKGHSGTIAQAAATSHLAVRRVSEWLPLAVAEVDDALVAKDDGSDGRVVAPAL
jgi:pimeloyl-ACP methyl ester carboxylesterase